MTSVLKIGTFVAMLATMSVSLPAWCQSPAEVAQMEQAMPATATAKASKPRRVLVYSQAIGYHHASIPYAEKAFEIMGQKTGAFAVDVTSDPAALDEENLKKYDAILLNNTTGDWLTTPSVRQALVNFVKSGKGLMGIHAATDGNYDWPEFGKLIGGYFDEHPWRHNDTVTLKLDRPKHPVNKAFVGKPLEVTDEIYQMKDPYSRSSVLELVSLDTTKTDMTKKGIKRTDGDFPVSWVKRYGKGRVFYTSLGHNKEIYWNPVILQHYLDGLQFALGDLKATAKPAGKLDGKAGKKAKGKGKKGKKPQSVAPATAPALTDKPSTGTAASKMPAAADLEKAVAQLDSYDFGKDRDFLLTIDEAIRASAGNDQQRKQMTDAFVKKALDTKLTYAARDLALRRIAEIGDASVASKLQPLLTDKDEKLAESALRAVTSIPGTASEQALLKAAGSATGLEQVGIVNALGQRRASGNDVIKALTKIARGGQTDQVEAAVTALGKIATPAAGQALLNDVRPPDAARLSWLIAMNNAADELAKSDAALAGKLYDRVLQDQKSPTRLAAFRGKAELSGHPEQEALKALDEGTAAGMEQVARQILVRGSDPAVASQLLERLKSATPEKKAIVVDILGARNDKDALPEITELAQHPSPEAPQLQLAAISALQRMGDQAAVPVLLKIAADQKGDAANAAQQAIVEMRVAEVDSELLRLITEAPSPSEQIIAINAAVERKAGDVVPKLMDAAASSNSKVAIAAFKALSQTATKEDLQKLLDLTGKLRDLKVIKEAGRTVAAVAKKEAKETATSVKSAYESASSEDIKLAMLGVLGRLGGKDALETLQQAMEKGDEKLKDAAVRALAEFPDPSALDVLMQISANDPSQTHKVLALRGVARLLSSATEGSTAKLLDKARRALELAAGADEKKAVIGAVAELKTTGVLALITPYLNKADLKGETVAAILKQAPIANQINPQKTGEELASIQGELSADDQKKLKDAVAPSDGAAGAIRAFEISSIYGADDKVKPADLMDKAFDPENGSGNWIDVVWAGIDEGGDKLGKLDLLQYYPGTKNAVVYLRADVWSPDDRQVEMRTGSDDGMKVWVDGKQVLATKPTRSFGWDDDKTKIDLKKGWNTVLIKVVQGSNDWAAAARLLSVDGKPMPDLKYSAVHQEK